jgi:hypothetical protein
MEEIPKQLAIQLPAHFFTIQKSSTFVKTHFTSSGAEIKSDIIATEANELVSKLKNIETEYRSVTNVYFQTTIAPSNKAVVILNA